MTFPHVTASIHTTKSITHFINYNSNVKNKKAEKTHMFFGSSELL